MSFVHLHVHTQYSLLDGFSDPKKLVARAKELGMPAVAITDHGTMFGVIEFFNAAQAAGVKPIIGLEGYMASRHMSDRDARLDKQSHHLLLLAENQTGYRNLLEIASASQLDGFYYYPRIDHDFLASHAEGLICTTGCMSSEVSRAIRNHGPEEARKLLDWYYEVFGADRFFFELQHHEIPELLELNKTLMQLGKRYNARYLATNDVHYINREDARLQDILLAIQTGSLITDPNRMKMSVDSFYLRSPQEMSALFPEVPEAISNTLLVADRCNVDLTNKGYHLPRFPVPEGHTAETYLRQLCEEGLLRRYGSHANDPEVRQRLEYELGVIHQMGFDAYFLIVWDLCRYAYHHGIWYNARGSAAGSMVAYTLDITLVEPMEHGLIFERFLNPGRISMPDIDLDFQDDMRSRVMEYCALKYGSDKVAQIITFGTMAARGAIRDVGRVMDIPLSEVDRISKMIPAVPGKSVSIHDALEQVPELKAAYDEAEYLKGLIDTAGKMEGVVRNAGTHAAGVVVSDEPIVHYVPLHRPTSGSEESPIKAVTQFEMSVIESLGLLKVDFLGLVTLTIMQRACDLIEQRHDIKLNLDNIPIDDKETFDFLSKGHTAGVFQLEGTGMTRFLVQMRPENLDNVIAMVALYRPGPLDFIPSYIRRMHKEEQVEYRHPAMEPIFEETYGIPVYQEQIMRAAVDLAGYTLSESDELRKAIAKKQKDKLEKHKIKFIKGAEERGIEHTTAEGIFTDWEEFARYGFNKSHAADYGIIAVQTAYLKTHYTVEYMTALLSASKSDTAKVAAYVADSRAMGIQVLPPDINTSGWDFTIEDHEDGKASIRFGMGAVKNVGQGPVDMVCQARQDGPFTSLTDFATRVDLRQVGKRSLECLIKVGAFDRFGSRSALIETQEQIISVSASHFRAAQSGQLSFFGAAVGVEEQDIVPGSAGLVNNREQLEWEKELIGLYVSDHPLSPYQTALRRRTTHFSNQLAEVRDKAPVTVAGIVTRFRNHQTKTGKSMGFVTLEDMQGNIDLVVFPSTWEKYHSLVIPDAVLIAEGKADTANGDPKILVDKLYEVSLEDIPVSDEGGLSAYNFADVISSEDEDGNIYDAPVAPLYQVPVRIPEPVEYMPEAEEIAAPPPAQTARPAVTKPAPKPVVDPPPARPVTPKPQPDTDPLEPPEMPDDWHLLMQDSQPVLGEVAMAAQAAPPVPPPPPEPEVRFAAKPKLDAPVVPLPPLTVDEPPVPLPVMPILVAPVILEPSGETQPRMVKVVFRSTGDKLRDVRRLKGVHGRLRSYPGRDKFAFVVFEGTGHYQLEFPNDTTGICQTLLEKLAELVGEENVLVEPIRIQ